MTKKSTLGTGLNELLSNFKTISADIDKIERTALKHLAIDLLKPGKYQPRRGMQQESLAELADSIRSQGIIQPLIVRPVAGGHYEIIAGERRWRAAQLANMHEVPVVVRDLQDREVLASSLIENIQREDLNAIDTALSLQRLIAEFDLTHEGAAAAIGKSRTLVTNLLRLLNLATDIQNMIQQGLIEMGHARALLSLDAAQQLLAANLIVKKRLSVRASEALVKQLLKPRITLSKGSDPNLGQLQKRLADKLGAVVSVKHNKKGQGKIIIKYYSLDELDGILKHVL